MTAFVVLNQNFKITSVNMDMIRYDMLRCNYFQKSRNLEKIITQNAYKRQQQMS